MKRSEKLEGSKDYQEKEESESIDYPYEFDEQRRKKARLYSKQKFYTGIIQTFGLYLPFLAITYFSGFTNLLESWIRNTVSGTFLSHHWIISGIFVIIYLILLSSISMPVAYYSGFKLEHKYDLSKDTILDWIKDQIKSLIISLILMVPIILALFFLGYTFPTMWWLYAGILLFVISGILSNISHLVILPLFYDLVELEDEDLKDRLVDMSEKHGVSEIKKVMVIKASEKTEKANAGFAGMGKTKRLLLFDTLLDKFHPKEIEGVVAHELGHYVNKDIIRYILISASMIFPIFYITGQLFTMSGSFEEIYHLPLFLLILYGLYSLIDPFTNAYSRYREKKADRFAIETTGEPQAMVSGFKRLSDIDLAEIDPHKLIEIFFYDHPAPKKRIEMAERFRESEESNKNDK